MDRGCQLDSIWSLLIPTSGTHHPNLEPRVWERTIKDPYQPTQSVKQVQPWAKPHTMVGGGGAVVGALRSSRWAESCCFETETLGQGSGHGFMLLFWFNCGRARSMGQGWLELGKCDFHWRQPGRLGANWEESNMDYLFFWGGGGRVKGGGDHSPHVTFM